MCIILFIYVLYTFEFTVIYNLIVVLFVYNIHARNLCVKYICVCDYIYVLIKLILIYVTYFIIILHAAQNNFLLLRDAFFLLPLH